MKSKLGLAFLLFATMLFGISAVSATTNFAIDHVEVDDMVAVQSGDSIFVERGQDSTVEVYLKGNGSSDNVKVKVYIGGYEYDDVEAVSEIFEVEPGVSYRKVLSLSIPEDLEASDDYTLRVKVYDDDDEIENNYILRIKEARHDVEIQDVIIKPDTRIDAGRPLFVTVRAENLGAKKEEDIKVTVSIPELGISARDYIDELAADEDSDNDEDNEDEEDSMSSNEILLRIPEDAKTGSYELLVKVEYNRGHSVVTKKEIVSVNGVDSTKEPAEPAKKAETVVSVDSTSKTVVQDSEVGYKVMLANLGSEQVLYSVEVAGEQLFADSRVEPSFVTVQPDKTGEFAVYLKAKPDASEGKHSFTVRVKSGNEVLQELSLSADVSKKSVVSTDSLFSGDVKQAVLIGLVVLVVVLIIVGLVIAFSRKNGDEPGAGEGQSYYYYPKY
ncbi:hypothetical protein J4231_00860 [Candidatus Woesearchaeota archaeon]|nr:hypothetical protein [Candidatus Woesearchaeota archaeon]